MAHRKKIAIIGAGLCGLTAARRLQDHAEVVVTEKSRGLGGRMSTRRAAPFVFDHGAQYFRAQSPQFISFVDQMREAGHVAKWHPKLVNIDGAQSVTDAADTGGMFVATPAMNSLCKHLAEGVTVLRSKRVATLTRASESWTITCEDGEELAGFDWVLSTAPAEQTRALLPEDLSFNATLQAARMQGNFTLMLGFEDAPALGWEAAKLQNHMLGWIASSTSKPMREGGSGFVVQSTHAWAERHLERPLADVEAEMFSAFQEVTGIAQAPIYQSLHRWRFAAVRQPAQETFLLDASRGLAAAGDWCGDGKVEAAYLSGHAAASAIAALL
ncbi:MAG: NAD(P)/FAD-dependent oxidoreductase [Roseobacter sp.]